MTAVEFYHKGLINILLNHYGDKLDKDVVVSIWNIKQEAKVMYRKQIIEAYETNRDIETIQTGEEYYNETIISQHLINDSVLKIKLTEYGYHCSDGCCYNYGTITTVNGIELPLHNQDVGTILSQVLEHLGYKVEIEYSDEVE